MIAAAVSILSVRVDARILHAASRLGRSITYLRIDVGYRTFFQWDLEYISREARAGRVVEYLLKIGPWQSTNRSYYVG